MTNGTGIVPKNDTELSALLAASPAYIKSKRAAETTLASTSAVAPQINQQAGGSDQNDSKALVPVMSAEASRFMPVMTVAAALERRQMIVMAIESLLVEGIEADFGIIPGTKKKTLLQPGAQKLDNLFGLVPQFETIEKVLDWTGIEHQGEPFFYFEIRCRLWRGDYLMGEGTGSCNSWESKYRYRTAERVCPSCSKDSIIKGKAEYGGGWLCFKKKGGCGAKFNDGDKAIEGQETGKKPNPDIHDVVNTVMKIANKRAHVSATINATSASEFFTQDVEEKVATAAAPTPIKPWTSFTGMLEAFRKMYEILPEDFFQQILFDAGVQKPEDFKKGPKRLMSENAQVALDCYRRMEKIVADMQALEMDPTTFEHFAATEGAWS